MPAWKTPLSLPLLPLLVAALLVLALSAHWLSRPTPEPVPLPSDLTWLQTAPTVSYENAVRPILDRRCVVCHGCYDAPCQLKLSSAEGLYRGGTKEKVYNSRRIRSVPPTRLFIDAKSTEQWRDRGFHPVLNEEPQSIEQNLKGSVLYRLLRLKEQHPQAGKGKLPDSFTLDLNRQQSCPKPATVDQFAAEHPLWGMPYAMPNLSQEEYRTLVAWLAQGAQTTQAPGPSPSVAPRLRRWEAFFNQPGARRKLVSRYLYEHLFHAHIHFSDSPAREFYRLVRSRTPPGQPIDEIATIHPYDDPGPEFYYRLLRYHPTIVVKNHIVYEFSPWRMQRYHALFIQPDYTVPVLPSYQPGLTSNPFKVFADIPADSRYRFLLDDARFFIEGFIKGPVCRGQIALNVIEDRFWVLFFDPEQSVLTNNPHFIADYAEDLQIPSARSSKRDMLSIWTDYWQRQKRYMQSKQDWFEKMGRHDLRHAMNFIWDGEGNNPNAALTVFRHFDSGSVAWGLVGDHPETAWILDYPMFERIHYLLVAGFNVYGDLVHQLNTRIYMDFLRMEGEDHFLAFLPASRRKAVRDSWYIGQRSSIEKLFAAPKAWLSVDSITGYQTDDPQQELYQQIQQRLAPVATKAMSRNRCNPPACTTTSVTNRTRQIDTAMHEITRLRGEQLHAFPDVAFVRVRMADGGPDQAYTLIRDKAYKNVTSFLADEKERDRADIQRDTMTVVNWLEGSYPNFFFSVAESELEDFTRQCATIKTQADYDKFVERYGIRRTNRQFWATSDWFQETYRQRKPVTAGLFDLNRYKNH